VTERLVKYLHRYRPNKIVAVGDATVLNIARSAMRADVYIVDNQVMRRRSEPVQVETEETVIIQNPPATITAEAWDAISRAVQSNRSVKIVVEGEEDLLTLPAIVCAPLGSAVIYGQPGEGAVVVRVTESKKAEARRLVALMSKEDD